MHRQNRKQQKLPLKWSDFGLSRQRPQSSDYKYFYRINYVPHPDPLKKVHVEVSMPSTSECNHIWRWNLYRDD